jgi:hypothetical protein
MKRRAIVFFAWGANFIGHLARCLRESRLPDYPVVVITDSATDVGDLPSFVTVVRRHCQLSGKVRKVELLTSLPEELETVLFLDVDARVIGDISLGFEKAEKHGIAMAPAPHYSLPHFRDFRRVMLAEGITPCGQVVYNSGVMFFAANRPDVRAVFDLALQLAKKYDQPEWSAEYDHSPWSDQPYLTLAMEELSFNPYTLSPSFNYRGFGELISGSIHVWHSYAPVPDDAASLQRGYLHRYENGRIVRVMKVPL